MKVSIIFGTRPEAIKMAMLIKAFHQSDTQLKVCFTGQHKEMVLPLIDFFELPIDDSLEIMRHNQSLSNLTSRSLDAIDHHLKKESPDIVFVQGDTTTAMCAATAAFYNHIKVAHIEAGLRTYDLTAPFPEEFNRRSISLVADFHFAPTAIARQNLLNEMVEAQTIHVTGNTVVDALHYTKEKLSTTKTNSSLDRWIDGKPFILITGHRRENFGEGFQNICKAIRELAVRYSNCDFVYPVHLNPNVQEPVRALLADLENVFLIEPLDYFDFVQLMMRSKFILTDSGGIQEEAASLKKPTLVMRNTTERMEAVNAGIAKLVGSDTDRIIESVSDLMDNQKTIERMTNSPNPFGDGMAAKKIVEIIESKA